MKVNFEVLFALQPLFATSHVPAEHKVKGDTLCHLKAEDLKALGITTIGQRLSILKAIYLVKLAHNVPMDETHYVPPCESSFFGWLRIYSTTVPPAEAPERVENINMDKLHSIVKDQGTYLCRQRCT